MNNLASLSKIGTFEFYSIRAKGKCNKLAMDSRDKSLVINYISEDSQHLLSQHKCSPTQTTFLFFSLKLIHRASDKELLTEDDSFRLAASSPMLVRHLLLKQGRGQCSGPLTVSGKANIFYVVDLQNKTVQALSVLWTHHGWCVSTFKITDPQPWQTSDLIFFNSEFF